MLVSARKAIAEYKIGQRMTRDPSMLNDKKAVNRDNVHGMDEYQYNRYIT